MRIPSAMVLVVALLLAACDSRDGGGDQRPALASREETFQRRAPGCANDDECTSVRITWEVFEGRPLLNRAVETQLIRQLQGNGEGVSTAPGLEAVADTFITDAGQMPKDSAGRHWLLTGKAQGLGRWGELLTVEISSYAYSGGAHGLPATHWLNWDLANDEPVTLKDVVKPGREAVFWKLVEASHQRCLEQVEADDDFPDTWPFQQSEDFRFDDEGLTLLYGVYVLGPYSMGQVELAVPWEALLGVVREQYLPN